jgi:uncharacterized BrkB/YihY/UPF0761 family membrane protein
MSTRDRQHITILVCLVVSALLGICYMNAALRALPPGATFGSQFSSLGLAILLPLTAFALLYRLLDRSWIRAADRGLEW